MAPGLSAGSLSRRAGPWWDWGVERHALAWLFAAGELRAQEPDEAGLAPGVPCLSAQAQGAVPNVPVSGVSA